MKKNLIIDHRHGDELSRYCVEPGTIVSCGSGPESHWDGKTGQPVVSKTQYVWFRRRGLSYMETLPGLSASRAAKILASLQEYMP